MGDERQYRNTNTPLGTGERASPIPLRHTTMRSIAAQGVEGLRAQIAMSGHDESRYLPRISQAAVEAQQAVPQPRKIASIMARGATVYDIEKQKRVVIMKANVAYTPKGRPIHRVMAKNGDSWLQKESKLKARSSE